MYHVGGKEKGEKKKNNSKQHREEPVSLCLPQKGCTENFKGSWVLSASPSLETPPSDFVQ